MQQIVKRAGLGLRRMSGMMAMPVYRRRYGLVHITEPYFIRDTLNASSVAIDCGLGEDGDFSAALMSRYGLVCHGVDPTRKHQQALSMIAAEHRRQFQLHPCAVAGRTGFLTFYEAMDQVSGSIFDGHVNARASVPYTVPCITIPDLIALIGGGPVDILKMDIEGAEYEVLASMPDSAFANIHQMIIEFHHHCVNGIGPADTRSAIDRLSGLGYHKYSVDGLNYLFFRL